MLICPGALPPPPQKNIAEILRGAPMTLQTDPRSTSARTLWGLILALLPWPIMAFLLTH